MTANKKRLDDVDIGLHMAIAISEAEGYNECSAAVSTAHSNLVIAEMLLRAQERSSHVKPV